MSNFSGATSSRLASTASRTMYFDGAYAPFGELYAGAGTSNWSNWSFTGQTMDLGNDSVTGIFDFPLRQQSPNQGRWLVPDPAGMAAVDITNPQTWNRYAYVMNNPLSNIDPLGLYHACFRVAWACTWDTDSSWGPGEFQLMTLPVYTYGWNLGLVPWGGSGPSLSFPGGDATTQIGDYGYYWGLINLGTIANLPGGLNLLNWTLTGLGTAEEAFDRLYPDPTKPTPPLLAAVSNQPANTEAEIDAACSIYAINANNGFGGLPFASQTSSVSNGIVFQQRTQSGNVNTINPSSPNVNALMPLAAPGVFVQNSYVTCRSQY
jgi:RHS repeat-associated protein